MLVLEGDLRSFLWFPLQWHALSREEQAKYYELARKERQLHMQLYPGWSARDNYVSTVVLWWQNLYKMARGVFTLMK